MFKSIWFWFLRRIYRRLILKVIVLDTPSIDYYNSIDSFCEVELVTNQGVFLFKFKEDRRRTDRYSKLSSKPIISYIVQLEPPTNYIPKVIPVKDLVILVVKVALFRLDPETLVKVLVEIYIDGLVELSELSVDK